MKRIGVTLSILFSTGVAVEASESSGDIEAGKKKSAVCASCHGKNGISDSPVWPNLAGQKETYLIKQMRAFREGSRKDPQMSAMAKPLSNADIDNLAAYYASLSCQ